MAKSKKRKKNRQRPAVKKAQSKAKFRHEDISSVPKGWKVRTITRGAHEVRVAFPPGGRQEGSGRIVSILHPVRESNPEPEWVTKLKKSLGAFWEKLTGGKPEAAVGSNRKKKAKACPKKNPKRLKKNLDELAAAQKRYETFQGKPSKAVLELDEPMDLARDDLAVLAPLVVLVIHPRGDGQYVDGEEVKELVDEYLNRSKEPNWSAISDEMGAKLVWVDFSKDGITVASNAEGTQLYFLEGNQDLTPILDDFGGDTSKDLIELGDCIVLGYESQRKEDEKVSTIRYHCFADGDTVGYETSDAIHPIAFWNRVQQRIYLAGGSYVIERPGIVN